MKEQSHEFLKWWIKKYIPEWSGTLDILHHHLNTTDREEVLSGDIT